MVVLGRRGEVETVRARHLADGAVLTSEIPVERDLDVAIDGPGEPLLLLPSWPRMQPFLPDAPFIHSKPILVTNIIHNEIDNEESGLKSPSRRVEKLLLFGLSQYYIVV